MDDSTDYDEQRAQALKTKNSQAGALVYLMLNFLHFSALGAARPYFSLLASENQASMIVVGIITSLYSIGQVFWAMPLGRLIDRIGAKTPLIWGSWAFLAGVSGLMFVHNLFLIALCVMLVGLSHVAVLLGSQSVMTDIPAGAERSRFVGLYTFANSAGSFVGPLMGGYLNDRLGTSLAFSGAVAVGVLCLLLSFMTPSSHNKLAETENRGIRPLLKNKQIVRIILVSGIVLFSQEVTMSYFPIFGQDLGLTGVMIGTIISVRGMAQMLIRPFLKKIISLFRRDRVLIFCLVVGGISIVLHGVLTGYWSLIAVAVFTGMTLGLATPMTLLAVSDIAPRDQGSQVLALRVMGNYLGQSISPLIFGFLGSLLGLAPVFWISGAILAFSIRLLPRHTRPRP